MRVNQKEAFQWYEKTAKQGHADSKNSLGLYYQTGTGVEKDLKQSFVWLREAAEQRNATAQTNLGLCYYNGTGVEKDLEVAFLCGL